MLQGTPREEGENEIMALKMTNQTISSIQN